MKISWKETALLYGLGVVDGTGMNAVYECTAWYDLSQIHDWFFEYFIRWNGENGVYEVKWVNTRKLACFPDEALLVAFSPTPYNKDNVKTVLEAIKRQKRKLK